MNRLTFTDDDGDRVRLSDVDDMTQFDDRKLRCICCCSGKNQAAVYLSSDQLRKMGNEMIEQANEIESMT